jgi:hypothetical protein
MMALTLKGYKMWTSIVVKMVTSEMAKMFIALLVKKLLDHSKDGVTKEVSIAMLDGIAKSRANNVPADAFDAIKSAL